MIQLISNWKKKHSSKRLLLFWVCEITKKNLLCICKNYIIAYRRKVKLYSTLIWLLPCSKKKVKISLSLNPGQINTIMKSIQLKIYIKLIAFRIENASRSHQWGKPHGPNVDEAIATSIGKQQPKKIDIH